MVNINHKIQRALVLQWEAVRACIERLNNSAKVEPSDPLGLFKIIESDANVVEFEIGRTLLIFPERANDTSTQMHIVITGRLSIDKIHFQAHGQIRTVNFKSEAGYFRLKRDGTLQHVFGAHYDLTEDEIGHPAFHAQLKSFLDFADVVKCRYESSTLNVTNEMNNVLKTVRLPSAQMDYYSVLIQAIADHLISQSHSTTENIATFRDLLAKNKSIQGRAYQIPRLQAQNAITCYRSVHWYP
jgi:hypothetical protein